MKKQINTDEVHVTRISNGDVFGHLARHCDEGGCAGDELFFKDLDATDFEVGLVYEVDMEDGRE